MNASARPSNKAVRKGFAHLNAGRAGEAERLFRSVLKSEPDNAEANHALGTLAVQQLPGGTDPDSPTSDTVSDQVSAFSSSS